MVVVPPGVTVNVQFPVDGKPFKITLPVEIVQVGRVIVPTVGASGGKGWALITTSDDAIEVTPEELVTVYVYVPAASPIIVELVPVPVVVVPPGIFINVHVPVAGKPFKITLPVETVQVGCVIVPTIGAVGSDIVFLSTETKLIPVLAIAKSGLPSPSISPKEILHEPILLSKSTLVANEPTPMAPELLVFLKIETALGPKSATARSGFPSPSISPIMTLYGLDPVVKSTLVSNELAVIEPGVLMFLKIETVLV